MSKPHLNDKVVLITGGGKGAGRALAQALAAYGATVAANDVSPVNVEEVVASITAQGGKAKAYIEDVVKKVAVQAFIKMASSLHLIPTKGMTLPFLSYGGSSLLALAFGTGMLLAFTRLRVGTREA